MVFTELSEPLAALRGPVQPASDQYAERCRSSRGTRRCLPSLQYAIVHPGGPIHVFSFSPAPGIHGSGDQYSDDQWTWETAGGHRPMGTPQTDLWLLPWT